MLAAHTTGAALKSCCMPPLDRVSHLQDDCLNRNNQNHATFEYSGSKESAPLSPHQDPQEYHSSKKFILSSVSIRDSGCALVFTLISSSRGKPLLKSGEAKSSHHDGGFGTESKELQVIDIKSVFHSSPSLHCSQQLSHFANNLPAGSCHFEVHRPRSLSSDKQANF